MYNSPMVLQPRYRRTKLGTFVMMKIPNDELAAFDTICRLYKIPRSTLMREAMEQFIEREYDIAIKLKDPNNPL